MLRRDNLHLFIVCALASICGCLAVSDTENYEGYEGQNSARAALQQSLIGPFVSTNEALSSHHSSENAFFPFVASEQFTPQPVVSFNINSSSHVNSSDETPLDNAEIDTNEDNQIQYTSFNLIKYNICIYGHKIRIILGNFMARVH